MGSISGRNIDQTKMLCFCFMSHFCCCAKILRRSVVHTYAYIRLNSLEFYRTCIPSRPMKCVKLSDIRINIRQYFVIPWMIYSWLIIIIYKKWRAFTPHEKIYFIEYFDRWYLNRPSYYQRIFETFIDLNNCKEAKSKKKNYNQHEAFFVLSTSYNSHRKILISFLQHCRCCSCCCNID